MQIDSQVVGQQDDLVELKTRKQASAVSWVWSDFFGNSLKALQPLETGYSPFELDTGQHPRDPRLLWTKDLIHSKEQPDVETMLRTWRDMVSRSVAVYKEARMLAKEKADRFRRSPDFVVYAQRKSLLLFAIKISGNVASAKHAVVTTPRSPHCVG